MDKSIKEKGSMPQLTPFQLVIFMTVQIISIVESLLPAFIGGEINPTWIIISLVVNNVAYFLIMILRGKLEVKPELKKLFMKVIENIGVSLMDQSMSIEQKVHSAVRSIVLLIEELDILYEEDKEIVDAQFRDYIKAKAEELIYGKKEE